MNSSLEALIGMALIVIVILLLAIRKSTHDMVDNDGKKVIKPSRDAKLSKEVKKKK